MENRTDYNLKDFLEMVWQLLCKNTLITVDGAKGCVNVKFTMPKDK